MEFFQHRYYNTNKVIMSFVGLWPYQTTRFSRSILAVIWFIKTSVFVPQILAVVKYRDDPKFLMDCVAPILLVIAGSTKLICCSWNSQKMLQLLNSIRTHWEVWAGDEEVNILHKYAKQGRTITVAYAVTLYTSIVIYVSQPIVPKIIDTLLKNGSKTGEFPVPVDYYALDAQKYYFYIILHLTLCGCVEIVITIAADTMFMVYVLHGCGLFSALGHKLQQTGKVKKSADIGEAPYVVERNGVSCDHIAFCIDRHNDAIEYAVLIEATYSWYLFLIVGLTIIAISVTAIQLVNSMKYHEGMARYMGAFLCNTLRVYMDSHFCQMIMDHSISIRNYIYNSDWYKLHSKDQKLLRLVIMRSNSPCKLTAGKFSVMSVETFVGISKMSLSYFTLLRSM